MKKVVGAGSLVVDITAYVPHLPRDGETVLGKTVRFGPGGKGNNQMTAVHRAGAEAVVISKVGEDFLAEIMKAHYEREGMSKKYIETVKGGETGSALIEVDENTAQNAIVVIKGANDAVDAAAVAAAEHEFADCDAVLTQLETGLGSVLKCKELAQKYQKPFILNPAPYQEIPDGLFEGVDFLTPNETEAEQFTNQKVDSPESGFLAAEILLNMGVKNVVITLGKAGAVYANRKERGYIPAICVDAVDTTGAGDAFNGGLAAAIAAGMPIEKALQFANCAGALSVTARGTAPAMPRLDRLKEFMKKHYGAEVTELD